MILQPWRCTERKKNSSTLCCLHTTYAGTHHRYFWALTRYTPASYRLQKTMLEGTVQGTRFRCPVWGEMPSYKLSVKHRGDLNSLLRGRHAHRHLRQINPTSAGSELAEMESLGTRRHHRWSRQMLCPCTRRIDLVEQSDETLFGLQGTDSVPWQPEKGLKLQGTTWPGGTRRSGTAVLEKHLFAVKCRFQKLCSHPPHSPVSPNSWFSGALFLM